MKTPVFTGSCTAIVTPFHNGVIDFDKMAEFIDFQYEGAPPLLSSAAPPAKVPHRPSRSMNSSSISASSTTPDE